MTIDMPKKSTMNAKIIAQTGVETEIINANVNAAINISKNPKMPKYLAPKRSNKAPTIGDKIKLIALPGNKINPAIIELNNKAPFKYSGNNIPIDRIHNIVTKTIAVPMTNIGYLNTFKLSIGESILNCRTIKIASATTPINNGNHTILLVNGASANALNAKINPANPIVDSAIEIISILV